VVSKQKKSTERSLAGLRKGVEIILSDASRLQQDTENARKPRISLPSFARDEVLGITKASVVYSQKDRPLPRIVVTETEIKGENLGELKVPSILKPGKTLYDMSDGETSKVLTFKEFVEIFDYSKFKKFGIDRNLIEQAVGTKLMEKDLVPQQAEAIVRTLLVEIMTESRNFIEGPTGSSKSTVARRIQQLVAYKKGRGSLSIAPDNVMKSAGRENAELFKKEMPEVKYEFISKEDMQSQSPEALTKRAENADALEIEPYVAQFAC